MHQTLSRRILREKKEPPPRVVVVWTKMGKERNRYVLGSVENQRESGKEDIKKHNNKEEGEKEGDGSGCDQPMRVENVAYRYES